jgi:hypothetical protein
MMPMITLELTEQQLDELYEGPVKRQPVRPKKMPDRFLPQGKRLSA